MYLLKTEIFILQAHHGDCTLIKTFDSNNAPFNILIDGGTSMSFDFSLRKELKSIGVIDLLILTHIDSDHIGGIIKLIQNSLFDKIEIKNYWINCRNLIEAGVKTTSISYGEAKNLEELLIDKKEPLEKFAATITSDKTGEIALGIEIVVLSPTIEIVEKLNDDWPELSKEFKKKLDDLKISSTVSSQLSKGTLPYLAEQKFKPQKKIEHDIINSASIAFLIKGRDFSFLALADSRAEIIEKKLKSLEFNDSDNKLVVDYVKVSHHGSKNNTSTDLLDIIDCQNFIISTNGGGLKTKHPDRETIARILYHPKRDLDRPRSIYFNYPLSTIEGKAGKIFTNEEIKKANAIVHDNILKFSNNA